MLLSVYKTATASFEACIKKESEKIIGVEALKKVQAFAKTFDINKYKTQLSGENIQFIAACDSRFPKQLFDLVDPPIGLFVRGAVDILTSTHEKIAIVGTRKVTTYGRDVTAELATSLAAADFVIASGLAIGVDSIAHRSALEAGAYTIAVLGCGVDCCYPRENEALYRRILDKGGLIISEYPLSTHPTKGTFLMRNRIIAALSGAVLITEAGADSGALVTASYAKDLNRLVFAVPGSIHSSLSVGTTHLLKNGAILVSESEDILKNFGKKRSSMNKKKMPYLSNKEKKIVDLLRKEEKEVRDIASLLSMPVSEVLMYLSQLEIKEVVESRGGSFRLLL